MTTEQAKLVKAVQDHAKEHYNEEGWDFVVECYDYHDILELILEAKATTEADAIKAVWEICHIQNERRQDVLAEIF